MNKQLRQLKELLDQQVEIYNRPLFIEGDPLSIPHQFTKIQDIEITAFWTSVLSWGQRKTIICKANEFFGLMDQAPHDFILNHSDQDIKKLLNFKHRTFNTTDTLYFIHFFQQYYQQNNSLEFAFLSPGYEKEKNTKEMLIHFHNLFFSLGDFPRRTKKHIPTPDRKSTCKRLNLFLRWMVRNDGKGVDFGIWKKISPAQLICPLDVHVERVARKLNLIQRKQTDWITAVELTDNLKLFDPNDPVKYDYALFSLGVSKTDGMIFSKVE